MPGYLIDVPRLAYQTWEIAVLDFDDNTQQYEIDEEATNKFGRYLESKGYVYNKDHIHCQ